MRHEGAHRHHPALPTGLQRLAAGRDRGGRSQRIQRTRPVRIIEFADALAIGKAGIGHQRIEPAVVRERRVAQLRCSVRIGQVAQRQRALCTLARHCCATACSSRLAARMQDQGGIGCGHGRGDRRTDAARSAGDEDDTEGVEWQRWRKRGRSWS
jgi:hypothetical protein